MPSLPSILDPVLLIRPLLIASTIEVKIRLDEAGFDVVHTTDVADFEIVHIAIEAMTRALGLSSCLSRFTRVKE